MSAELHNSAGAGVFVACLATANFDALAGLLEPDVTLDALLPHGFHHWHGADAVAGAFQRWFGRVDQCELIATEVGQVGPRLGMHWRAKVSGGWVPDASLVVEQHVYADPGPTGRIQRLSLLCSGFVEERSDA